MWLGRSRVRFAIDSLARRIDASLIKYRKSQIAIEYAYRFQQKHPDAHVFWVYSSSGSRMYQGYLQIAEKLNLPVQIGQEVNVLRLVCEALSNSICGQWLLVLDNLDDMKVLESTAEIPFQVEEATKWPLKTYLPRSSKGLTLTTTKNCLVGNWMTDNEITRIEPLDESDAVLLFRSYLATGYMSDFNDCLKLNCLKLVKALEYMPLAITQAAAYIRNNEVSLDEYLEILHKSDEELSSLMDEEEKDSRRDFQSNCSIFRTWKISFDMIRRSWPRAADILCLMAVLDRQGVPERLLKCQKELEAEFKRSLGRLKAFSLISATKVEGDLGMHRLVQLAVREWITRDREIYKYQEEALEVMAREFPAVTYENWTWCQALLPHVLVVIRYKTSDEMIIPRARLLQNLGIYGVEERMYGLAFATLSGALALWSKCVELDKNADALVCRFYIAVTLFAQGKYTEAEELHRKVLKYRIESLGQDHDDTLKSMYHIAIESMVRSKFKEARDMCQQLLEKQKKILGLEHRDTRRTTNLLGGALVALGRCDEAIQMHEQTLQYCKDNIGPESKETLAVMIRLGILLAGSPRHEEGTQMLKQVIEVRNKVLGPQHPWTLSAMGHLSTGYASLGKHDEAKELREKVVASLLEWAGPENKSKLAQKTDLAETLFILDNIGQALENHREFVRHHKEGLTVRSQELPMQLITDIMRVIESKQTWIKLRRVENGK